MVDVNRELLLERLIWLSVVREIDWGIDWCQGELCDALG